MNEIFLNSLSTNGPWAVTAGILLHQVIKAWTNDRQQISTLLTEFRDAIYGLTQAVENLNK